MSFPNFKKSIIPIKNAAPVSFLMLGVQMSMVLKFSCPCIVWWNQVVAILIFIVPVVFALLMMLLFLRFEEQKNSGGSIQDSRERSKCEEILHHMVCGIPSLLWVCAFFIDGDYLACAVTDWNGTYTCDTKSHPNCLSWCKPEPNQERKETELYEKTQKWNIRSKVIGYALALVLCCLFSLIMRSSKDNNTTKPHAEDQKNNIPKQKERIEMHTSVVYQSESDNLRLGQNIVETGGAKFHKEAQGNMDDRKSEPEVSLTNQLTA